MQQLKIVSKNLLSVCSFCAVDAETPVWRKAGGQYPLCNACGVSKRAHGVDRKPPSDFSTEPEQGIPEVAFSQEDELADDEATVNYAPMQANIPQVCLPLNEMHFV